MSDKPKLTFWVIYAHPLDYPDGFVLRPQYLIAGNAEPVIDTTGVACDSVEKLRELIPPTATCIGRKPDDDPAILEVWIE